MNKNILILLFLLFSVSILYSQPGSPVLVMPPKEASVVSLTPTLQWNAVPTADCYYVYITYDSTLSFVTEECNAYSTSYTVPANVLSPDTKYYWCVTAHNESGFGDRSVFFSFTTYDATPAGSIQNLIDQVSTIGSLGEPQAIILDNFLTQAKHLIELDNRFSALVHMYLFKDRVFILRMSEMISQDNANSLNYSADGVIDLIQDLSPISIDPKKLEPAKVFSLYQNYPNPFNPMTTIEYSIPSNSFVSLKIYDMLGKEVTTLVDKYQQ